MNNPLNGPPWLSLLICLCYFWIFIQHFYLHPSSNFSFSPRCQSPDWSMQLFCLGENGQRWGEWHFPLFFLFSHLIQCIKMHLATLTMTHRSVFQVVHPPCVPEQRTAFVVMLLFFHHNSSFFVVNFATSGTFSNNVTVSLMFRDNISGFKRNRDV